jgi:small conductance mechanosensitive channel
MVIFLQDGNAREKVLDNVWLVKDVLWRSVNEILASVIERLPYIAAGIFVLFLFWILAKIARRIFLSLSSRTKLDNRLRILFSRLLGVILFVFGLFTAFTVVVPTFQFGDLIAGLGFTSFVIGFATKDILNNLLSGVLILWQQPFRIGD